MACPWVAGPIPLLLPREASERGLGAKWVAESIRRDCRQFFGEALWFTDATLAVATF
jgi:hypothetical protein